MILFWKPLLGLCPTPPFPSKGLNLQILPLLLYCIYFTEVSCPALAPPAAGYVLGRAPFRAGDVLQFHCNPEHTLHGRPILVCQDSGRWSDKPPTCKNSSFDQLWCISYGDVQTSNFNQCFFFDNKEPLSLFLFFAMFRSSKEELVN